MRNALDACRAGDGVKLIAERVESASGQLEIRVAILDNGPGLTDAALSQAWDIYYSGREAGRGLGIGWLSSAELSRPMPVECGWNRKTKPVVRSRSDSPGKVASKDASSVGRVVAEFSYAGYHPGIVGIHGRKCSTLKLSPLFGNPPLSSPIRPFETMIHRL